MGNRTSDVVCVAFGSVTTVWSLIKISFRSFLEPEP